MRIIDSNGHSLNYIISLLPFYVCDNFHVCLVMVLFDVLLNSGVFKVLRVYFGGCRSFVPSIYRLKTTFMRIKKLF